MAEKKYLDQNATLYLKNKIKGYVDGIAAKKVDIVQGKGLSTNDLTNELRDKILAAGDSSFDGRYASLTGKPKINNVEVSGEKTLDAYGIQPKGNYALKTEIPTVPTKLSELNNDKNFQTSTEVQLAITSAVGNITSFDTQIVSNLPLTGKKGTIYLKSSATSSANQAYDEYIWVNEKWEFIGTTAVDLSGYVKESELVPISNAEIDQMF